MGYIWIGTLRTIFDEPMLERPGYTLEEFWEVYGDNMCGCFHPDDRARVVRELKEALEQGEEFALQFRLLKKDGSYIWVSDIGKRGVDAAWHSAYEQMFCRVHSGQTGCAEFKTRDGAWCRITMSVVGRTNQGEPSMAVGIIEDITASKEMELALEDAHARDTLTGLYNREAGIRMAREFMLKKTPLEKCALMLLDIDDFGKINKEEGTVFANAVLQDVAKILRTETAPDDIQVRIGGDEFMLLVKHGDKDEAMALGLRIVERIKGIFTGEEGVTVSVSIGICATEVTNLYKDLYRCAESTLHYVKENGKGRACCYLDISRKLGMMLTKLYTDGYDYNDIEERLGYREDDIVAFALELLGKAKKLDDAVNLLLARVGKSYGLDRVTLAECNHDYLSIRFTYQWVRLRSDSQRRRSVYITREQMAAISSYYDDDGVSEFVYAGEAMPSCLHVAIWEQDRYAGALCFESHAAGFRWTPERKKTVKELTKVIASFVMKACADSVSRAKTEFLSRMSHEIRTPMNAISGMTAIAKSVVDHREKLMECLDKIEYANGYLLDLVNDVLDMSRIESGKMETNYEDTDLQEFCENLRGLMLPQADQKRLHFQVLNDYKGQRYVRMDRLHLKQVLVNMIGNALKFTESDGSVTVRVESISEDDEHVTLRFSIQDTGIGIPDKDLERIFNAFEQAQGTAGKYGGTGLGLSISSRLVQMMGGYIKSRK